MGLVSTKVPYLVVVHKLRWHDFGFFDPLPPCVDIFYWFEIWVQRPLFDEKKAPHFLRAYIGNFEIQGFRYRLQCWLKVSANLGFGYGIRPKPKQWFRSYTSMNVDKNWTFLDHLSTSSCKHSIWTFERSLRSIE